MSQWSCRWLQVDDTVFSRQFNGGRACQVISLPSRCASDLTCCPTFSSGVLVAKLGRSVLRLYKGVSLIGCISSARQEKHDGPPPSFLEVSFWLAARDPS